MANEGWDLWFVDRRSGWRWLAALTLFPVVWCGGTGIAFMVLAALAQVAQGHVPFPGLLVGLALVGPLVAAIAATIWVLGPGYRARSVRAGR